MYNKKMRVGELPEGTYFKTALTDLLGVVTDEALPDSDGGVRVIFGGEEKVLHPDVIVLV